MLVAEFQQYFFGFSIFISSLFLVMLVLVQRGRGGGLTGALGGAGGQSAFGTKAGDLFTRITVGVAAVWIFLCAAAVFFLRDRALPQTGVDDRNIPAATGTATPGAPAPATPDLGSESAAIPSGAASPAAGLGGAVGGVSETTASDLPAATAVPETAAAETSGATPAATPAQQPASSAAEGTPDTAAVGDTPAAAEQAAPSDDK